MKAQSLPSSTADQLLAAAVQEFAEHGFAGTDSNRIARRAGYAPQTFYRWYDDKLAIFLAAYRAWVEDEHLALASLSARAGVERLIDTVLQHHRAHRLFRRSLRQLALEEPQVRKARAESRLQQVEWIRARQDRAAAPAAIAALLLQLERLADALAEEELSDMGFDDKAARAAMARLVRELKG